MSGEFISLSENHKVVTNFFKYPFTMYAHVHILSQLEQLGSLCQYNLSYRKKDFKSRYNPKLPNCLQAGKNHLVASGT